MYRVVIPLSKKMLLLNDQIEQMRLSATKSFLERRDTIVVASVSAIYGLGDPDSYLQMMLHLQQGAIIDQRQIFSEVSGIAIYKKRSSLSAWYIPSAGRSD